MKQNSNTRVDVHDLMRWAESAVQELQDFVDDANSAVSETCTDQLISTQSLIEEFECIKNGRPTWAERIRSIHVDERTALDDL